MFDVDTLAEKLKAINLERITFGGEGFSVKNENVG